MSVNFPFNKVGDRTGQITAEMNISDLKALVGGENDPRELWVLCKFSFNSSLLFFVLLLFCLVFWVFCQVVVSNGFFDDSSGLITLSNLDTGLERTEFQDALLLRFLPNPAP